MKIKNSILDGLKLFSFILKYVGEIIKLYSYLFVFIYLIYRVLSINEICVYMLILVILLGIYKDKRIKGLRYILLILFVMLHVVILKEGWLDTEILIIKDLFWYSLLMLGSFIWHVLILNGLYKGCENIKWDYGCYIISRWSLLTSLTMVLFIFQGLQMILDYYVKDYIRLGCSGWDPRNPLTGKLYKESGICNIGDGYKCLEVIVKIGIVIIEYFSIVFQNYSKMLLGLNEKIKWREIPKRFYIYFILTFILSGMLMTPRIYIIGVILLIWNVSIIIKWFILHLWKHYTDLNFRKSYFEKRRTLMGCLFSNIYYIISEKRDNFRFINGIDYDYGSVDFDDFVDLGTDNGKLLYESGLTRDYYGYSRLPIWRKAEYMRGIYEVLYIFEYSPERYKNLIIRMFKSYVLYNDASLEEYMNLFKEGLLINEEWFILENILDDYFVEGPIPNKIAEKGINSYSWKLSRKEGHKGCFMKLFIKKEIVLISGRL